MRLNAPATPLIISTATSQTPPAKSLPMLKTAPKLSLVSLKKATILGALLAMLLLRLSTNLLRPSIKPLSLSVPSPRLNTLENASMIVPRPLETCSPKSLNFSVRISNPITNLLQEWVFHFIDWVTERCNHCRHTRLDSSFKTTDSG